MHGVISMTDRTERRSDTSTQGEQSPVCDGRGPALVQVPYDPARDDLTTTIIRAIANAEDVSIVAIKGSPLYDAIDTAALDRSLFGIETNGPTRKGTGAVEFEYLGFTVVVESDGWISVHNSGHE